ncbi:MAG: hypothetical protein JO006_15205 [Paucibacter sp.]|nr:hypothetical protein [Roseateles sp.]
MTSIWSTGVLAACNGGQPVEQEPEAKIAANAAVAANGRSRQSRIVLPLDHGPRAVTTPALNKKRLEEARKEQLCDTSNS